MPKQTLRELLLDLVEAKNIQPKEMASKSKMPMKYLEAILEDKKTELPPFPYIRSYLVALAEVLGVDENIFIEKYKEECFDKSSGPSDKLPTNRFALRSGKKRVLGVVIVLAIIIAGYIVVSSGFFGRPELTIFYPPEGEGQFIVYKEALNIRGTIDPGDKLLINNQLVQVDDNGSFSFITNLSPELNFIEFNVQKFLGGDLRVVRQVYYEPPLITPLPLDTATTTIE